ncbi:nucleotide-binding universal stress UspA family protein [Caballeronia udeis]|uniref:Nucleotide-binding universal stress UspA family protein n=1 Tax=Caballeronia udeis TaxID=1232866 RepID=A0ABW8MJF3_9BURK
MYKRILVAIDGSETSVLALDAALQIAREADAEVQPVYIIDAPLMVYDAPGYDPSILRDALTKEGTRATNEALAKMQLQKIRGVARIAEVDLYGDGIAQRLLLAAGELKADLVVMGTHGRRGFQRLLLGSVAERFVRMATCPVLLVPAPHQRTLNPAASAAAESIDNPA